jgi:hypothetical protein
VSAAVCRFPITDSHDQEPTVYRHELVRALMLTVSRVGSLSSPGREHAERQPRSSCRDPPTAIRWSRPSTEPWNWRLVVRVARSI